MVNDLVTKNVHYWKLKINDKQFHHKYVYFIIGDENYSSFKIKNHLTNNFITNISFLL